MRIGLLSDTHVPEAEKELPDEVMEAFRGVDLILHAGDIYIPAVLDQLQQVAPVLAARGDDDYGAIERDERVKERHVITLDGHTLWLIHERPYPYRFPELRAKNAADEPDPDAPDVVVFGHEHSTFVGDSGGVLFVNPGSPTFLRYRRGLGTVGILTFDSGRAEAQILQL